MGREPKSPLARYAYGYSDKKPWGTVVILAGMVLFLIWRTFA